MIRFDALAAAMLMAAAAAGSALGGDLPPEISVPEVSVKDAKGFYGRVDLGYAVDSDHHDARSGAAGFDSSRFSGGDFSGGIGVGYQFTDLIRADVTGDLFRGKFSGFSDAGKSTSSYSAGGLLANGYVDLGTLAGFTPYLGAGLGATRVNFGGVETTAVCGATACATTHSAGQDDWRFTYALMAGVAYQLAPNVKLDLGYRYSHVAGGDMVADPAGGTTLRDGALARQEIRVGLRVSTW